MYSGLAVIVFGAHLREFNLREIALDLSERFVVTSDFLTMEELSRNALQGLVHFQHQFCMPRYR